MENLHELSSVETLISNRTNHVVETLMSNGNHLQVQDKYILPQNERPRLSEVSYSESFPVVDLQELDGPNRTRVVEEIRRACEEDGFFQVHEPSIPLLIAILSFFCFSSSSSIHTKGNNLAVDSYILGYFLISFLIC